MTGDRDPNILKAEKGISNQNIEMEGMGEPDTCRICRGEGDHSEALFHPCKCSGSIKFVHQDCLMEWLSHSQKKHCELCKTPFRFTKLYSPNMPQSLPLHVLIRHFLIHTVKLLTSFMRMCLVIVVWLALLPYTIRQVWRLLFWFSDGGWPPNQWAAKLIENQSASKAFQLNYDVELQALTDTGTSSVATISKFVTKSGYIRKIMSRLAGILTPASFSFNLTGSDVMLTSLLKSIYHGLGTRGSVIPENVLKINNSTIPPTSSSLLSEIYFFQNLTRSSTFNQVVINIAEGYVITILVVFCFVLVFLIREWVVQQHPGMNMGVGFNAEIAVNERPRNQQQNLVPLVDVEAEVGPGFELGHRPGTPPRRINNLESSNEVRNTDIARLASARNALAQAVEIQRSIADQPGNVGDFPDIFRRAEGHPREIIRIIETEGRAEEFTNILNHMKSLQNITVTTPQSTQLSASEIVSSIGFDKRYFKNSTSTAESDNEKIAQADRTEFETLRNVTTNSEKSTSMSPSQLSMLDPVFNTDISRASTETRKDKGKSRAYDFDNLRPLDSNFLSKNEYPNSDLSYFEPEKLMLCESNNISNNLRPRSISDSPQLKGPSPLSTNSWSFPQVSTEEEENTTIFSFDKVPVEKSKNLKGKASSSGAGSRTRNCATSSENITRIGESARDFGPIYPNTNLQRNIKSKDEGCKEVTLGQNSLIDERSTSSNYPDIDINENINSQPNSLLANVHIPEIRDPIVARPAPPTIFGLITDFLWGEIDNNGPHEDLNGNDEAVNDLADHVEEALEVDDEIIDQANNPGIERGFAQEAIAQGIDPNDPDAIEDAEDFDGIFELLGMRGPLFSLIQNALFSALLLAVNITVGVWTPYNIGRVSLLLIANPGPTLQMPLRIMFGCAAFLQDFALGILGMLVSALIQLFALPYNISSIYFGSRPSSIMYQATCFGSAATEISLAAFQRVKNDAVNNVIYLTDPEISILSAACHESLIIIRNLGSSFVKKLGAIAVYIFTGNYHMTWENTIPMLKASLLTGVEVLRSLPGFLIKPDSWIIGLNGKKHTIPVDLELSIWNGPDRFCAILSGYAVLCILGALYVKKRSPHVSRQAGRNFEAVIIDFLNQAGGVLKVILIISIEMLAFPLYCGLLLDIALLPLFENTTVLSRVLFTLKSPLTSIFVHWFVGTCYMFHFALFVSMCRKIIRKGVLYPDDPTFHPVRDVLERSVTTQLQKILFSALVYGGLILVCLGGVIWGISFVFKGVLPIHWSSNEPVLEFPIDLLFYNFLIPLAVKFLKPSTRLHSMYSWWFRQCARILRLTWFMFDERKIDEEGHLVRKTWWDVFRGAGGDPYKMITSDDSQSIFEKNPELRAYYRKDGRYVRAPASDQVRIPKGSCIFLEVNEMNERIDHKPDQSDGIHGRDSKLCKQVYLPPWFRLRISIFILSIWIFAAFTGVSVTILPLVFGRMVFAKIVPLEVRKNDAYAFSIGIYILGSALYFILNIKSIFMCARRALALDADTPKKFLNVLLFISTQVFSITWTYSAFLLIFPTLFAFLIELYFVVPLHTYFAVGEKHVIHFVQSWTLGLLYVNLTTRLILWYENSRLAQSLRAITRNGYLNPDARLATRGFIFPSAILLSTALFSPWALGRIMVITILQSFPEKHVLAYRYSYPVCLFLCSLAFVLWALSGWVSKWKMKIRDEVYSVGERLHNYGERKIQVVQTRATRKNDS